MTDTYKCPLCSRSKPPWQDLCNECVKVYGKTRKAWPDFVLFLVQGDDAKQKRDNRVAAKELNIGNMDTGDLSGLVDHLTPSPLSTRPGEQALIDVGIGRKIYLSYAPYPGGESSSDNIRYRVANGIPERD